MNRGEHYKILKIKIDIPSFLEREMTEFCCRQWLHPHMNGDSRNVIEQSVKDSYTRLIQPQITRLVRFMLKFILYVVYNSAAIILGRVFDVFVLGPFGHMV